MPRASHLALLLAALMVLTGAPNPAGADGAGLRQITVPAPHRNAPLDALVWYPASGGGSPVSVGQSIFFQGTEAFADAPIADGPFPVIVASHGAGLGGRASALSWLAAPLAEAGFVVVAPTHPFSTGPDRSAAETMRLWTRPQDLSATLDAVLADPNLAAHLDPARIGALGLSMGGHTALALSGARIDGAALAAYCDTDALNPSLCTWVRMSGVDLRSLDLAAAAEDQTDPRIGYAMAIDPALIDIFDPASFGGIGIPLGLVNLGPPEELPATLNAAPAAAAIPAASYRVVEEASHYSMFGLCTPAAADIALEEAIDEPICSDGRASSRGAVHAELVTLARDAFTEALVTAP